MAVSSTRRRVSGSERARRRREERETIRALAGENMPLMETIRRARKSSQLTTLPGTTWEDIFK